jgi:hypothetical protein
MYRYTLGRDSCGDIDAVSKGVSGSFAARNDCEIPMKPVIEFSLNTRQSATGGPGGTTPSVMSGDLRGIFATVWIGILSNTHPDFQYTTGSGMVLEYKWNGYEYIAHVGDDVKRPIAGRASAYRTTIADPCDPADTIGYRVSLAFEARKYDFTTCRLLDDGSFNMKANVYDPLATPVDPARIIGNFATIGFFDGDTQADLATEWLSNVGSLLLIA